MIIALVINYSRGNEWPFDQ